jgi:hypothetical protein
MEPNGNRAGGRTGSKPLDVPDSERLIAVNGLPLRGPAAGRLRVKNLEDIVVQPERGRFDLHSTTRNAR